MNKLTLLAVSALLLAAPGFADTIYLRSGQQYSGHLMGETAARLGFQDNQGVHYDFPYRDLRSISFSQDGQTVVMRNGRSYYGQIQGPLMNTISWVDDQGYTYQFSPWDVSSINFTNWQGPYQNQPQRQALVLPAGTMISVMTDQVIDSRYAQPGQTFPAQITQDVTASDGRVVIPRNSAATLMIRSENGGGVHQGDVVLDLSSVSIHGVPHNVVSSSVVEKSGQGVGSNRRTGEYVGGGAVLGALIGAIAGGGKGAAIGAAAGAGAGLGTEVLTHGHRVYVPAETTLTFELDRSLVLSPGSYR
jgi:hypothetical protein